MSFSATDVLMSTVVGAPALAVVLLAIPAWFGARPGERTVVATLSMAFSAALISSLVLLGVVALGGDQAVVTHYGSWFHADHYAFEWRLVGDHLSLPFAAFAAALVGLVGAFSRRYLHREPGFMRFYLMLAIFGAGVELVVLAGSLDLVFFGWELVGLTSALLIGFFHERPKPVEHGLRALITYRACDVGLLGAAVWMHHSVGTAAFAPGEPWFALPLPATAAATATVGLLLLWASMGKSGQVPLGGWLPRAMEGPTNSSAIFYGAISIHLGPYLLLRAAPILEASPVVAYAVIAIGGLTAIHGVLVGHVQTDVKSSLAYASMTQVGLIFVEIGFGLRYLALIHIVGHATLRALQILRSPSLLHDHHHLEQQLGGPTPRTGRHYERLVPKPLQGWLYRHALERGYFDVILMDGLVAGFQRTLRAIDRVDRAIVARIGRDNSHGNPHKTEDDR